MSRTTTLAKRKSRASARITLYAQPRIGPPLQLSMVLSYSDFVAIASAAGVIGTQKFRCNGLFDPDVTGTGHQPLYFDNFMAIYDHFTVTKSKLTWKFCNPTGLTTPSHVAAYIDDDTSAVTTFLAASEQNTASWTTLMPTDNSTHTFTKYWDAVKYFGPNPLANDNLQGTASADPSEQSIFTLVYSNSAANSTLTGVVNIQYHVTFDELKTQEVN